MVRLLPSWQPCLLGDPSCEFESIPGFFFWFGQENNGIFRSNNRRANPLRPNPPSFILYAVYPRSRSQVLVVWSFALAT